ncbi:MAG: diacylglycerol kinase [Pseudomonadota bacterium]|jgi:diacylglycerol kinase (ATP)
MRNKFLGTGEPGYHPLRKIAVIAAGLRYAVLHDFSVMYKVVLSVGVLLIALWLHNWVDAAVILLATGLVVAAELFNTAIEALCDFVETRHNEKIGIIKDIAAAATGIVILAWWIVLGVELVRLWPRLAAAVQGLDHAV